MFVSLQRGLPDICSREIVDLCWSIVVDVDGSFSPWLSFLPAFMMWYEPERWPVIVGVLKFPSTSWTNRLWGLRFDFQGWPGAVHGSKRAALIFFWYFRLFLFTFISLTSLKKPNNIFCFGFFFAIVRCLCVRCEKNRFVHVSAEEGSEIRRKNLKIWMNEWMILRIFRKLHHGEGGQESK